MIESPVLQRVLAERSHKMIVAVLEEKFGSVPPDVVSAIVSIRDEARLDQLVRLATRCPDLDAFRRELGV
jgi:hypothetical protein